MSVKGKFWPSIGSISKTMKMDADVSERILNFANELQFSIEVDFKFKEEVKNVVLQNKNYIYLSFNPFEDQKENEIGRARLQLPSNEWGDIGTITRTKKCSDEAVENFLDILDKATPESDRAGSPKSLALGMKVYLPAALGSECVLREKDFLLVKFGRREKQPNFVLGEILIKD